MIRDPDRTRPYVAPAGRNRPLHGCGRPASGLRGKCGGHRIGKRIRLLTGQFGQVMAIEEAGVRLALTEILVLENADQQFTICRKSGDPAPA